MTLVAGQFVQRKTGGVPMKVVAVNGPMISCRYIKNGKLCAVSVREDKLKAIKPPKRYD